MGIRYFLFFNFSISVAKSRKKNFNISDKELNYFIKFYKNCFTHAHFSQNPFNTIKSLIKEDKKNFFLKYQKKLKI